jgi:hypothetical protein
LSAVWRRPKQSNQNQSAREAAVVTKITGTDIITIRIDIMNRSIVTAMMTVYGIDQNADAIPRMSSVA